MKNVPVVGLLLRHWLVIGVITLLVGAVAYGVSASRDPQYSSTSSTYVSAVSGPSGFSNASNSTFVQEQMPSFGELASSPKVLNEVINDLHLSMTAKELGKRVKVTVPRNTVVLSVAVADSDPAAAALISNAIIDEFGRQLPGVGPQTTSGAAVRSEIIQPAVAPTVRIAPNTKLNTLLGLLIGFVLACVGVYIAGRLDDRIRTSDRVIDLDLADFVGVLGYGKSADNSLIERWSRGDSRLGDARGLSAGIEAVTPNGDRLVIVTALETGDGGTTVAINLAAGLAERGNAVLLVDANLRDPSVSETFHMADQPGIMQIGTDAARDSIRRSPFDNVDVLGSGGSAGHVTSLLSATGLQSFLSDAFHTYDFVVVDAPSLRPEADVLTIGRYASNAVLVVDADRRSRTELAKAVSALEVGGLRACAIVLNHPRTPRWSRPQKAGASDVRHSRSGDQLGDPTGQEQRADAG